jgi:NAD+ kinase
MKIALYGKKHEGILPDFFNHFLNVITENNCIIYIYKPFYTALAPLVDCDCALKYFSTAADLKHEQVDVLISFGGDGTILNVLELIQNIPIPVLGVNLGRLGFLAATSLDEFDLAIHQLLHNEYDIEQRSLLHLIVENNPFQQCNFALNEITVQNHYASKMLSIGIWVDDNFLNYYWGDGIIVATPTGSTAYSMSCGGNILTPSSKNFIITPIAPHNLSVRSIVISEESKIRIQVQENRINNYAVTMDSRSAIISNTSHILIDRAPFGFNLIRLKNKDFFQTLRNKLNWGLDKRN